MAAKAVGVVFLESAEDVPGDDLTALIIFEHGEIDRYLFAVRVFILVFARRALQCAIERQNVVGEVRRELVIHILVRGHRDFAEVTNAAIANLRGQIWHLGGIVMIVLSDCDPGRPDDFFVDRMTGEAVEPVRHYLLGRGGLILRPGTCPPSEYHDSGHSEKESRPGHGSRRAVERALRPMQARLPPPGLPLVRGKDQKSRAITSRPLCRSERRSPTIIPHFGAPELHAFGL